MIPPPSPISRRRRGDNSDPDYYFNLGYTFWRSAILPEAVTRLRANVERNPNDTEATTLLDRADGPRPGELHFQGPRAHQTNYEETAYRQLQAELQSKK